MDNNETIRLAMPGGQAKPMTHVVQWGGGACSYMALRRTLEAVPVSDVVIMFADTNSEDEDLYRFNTDVQRRWNVDITVLSDGRTPWQVFRDSRFLGNSRVDLCSRVLKRELLWRFIRERFDPSDTVLVFGLDWTEPHRLAQVQKRNPGWRVEAPMMEAPRMNKAEMLEQIRADGIRPPRLYEMGYAHNNCGGACVKAGQAQWELLLRTMPDRYAEQEREEELLRDYLGADVSILRDRAGGDTRPLTLRAFRERLQAEPDMFDRHAWGGCGCGV